MDLDVPVSVLRDLVVLDEERSFAAAARRLATTQSALSRHLERVERVVGVSLFARAAKSVRPTPAGEAFLRYARQTVELAGAATEAARLAALPSPTLRVGFFAHSAADVGPGMITKLREHGSRTAIEFASMTPREDVLSDSSHALDAAVIWEPVDHALVNVRALRREPRVAVLPARHPLAGRRGSILEIAELPIIALRPAKTRLSEAFWAVDPRPDGSHPHPGPTAESIEEHLAHVAGHRGTFIAPASLLDYYHWSQVAPFHIDDIAPATRIFIWLRNRDTAEIREVARAAEQAAEEAEPGPVMSAAMAADD